MGEWKEYRFSDFVCINPTVKLPKENISFVEMKDLNESTRYCMPSQERPLSGGSRFEEGDTLFARITPCLENGKICQVKGLKNGKGFGSTEFYVFRGKKNLSDTDFVYYLSRWEEVRNHAEKNMDGTSGRQRVPKEAFSDLYLSLPEMSIQKNIVSILSVLDDKINLLHLQNTTLEKMAETIFRQWFIEEAEENWENISLSEFAIFSNGKSRPNESGMIPIYGGNGILGFTNKSNYSGKSIIIGRVGAYCGSLYYENRKIWVSDNALHVKAKNEDQIHFLFYQLKNLNLNSMAQGSSHPLLTQTLLKSIKIIKPSDDKIFQFNQTVEYLKNKFKENKIQIQILTQLRDTLLPKLMSGEIKVTD